MFARISDTVCRCLTAALFVIVIQMSFLSAYIGKYIPSVNAAAIFYLLAFKALRACSVQCPRLSRTAHGRHVQTSTKEHIVKKLKLYEYRKYHRGAIHFVTDEFLESACCHVLQGLDIGNALRFGIHKAL